MQALKGPLPSHIAIVMDGNGRWAAQRGRARTFGHHRGARAARRAVECCVRRGIAHLTLFAFSSENWSRPADEVGVLMKLFMRALRTELAELRANGVRLRFIGDLSRFSPALQQAMADGERSTADGRALNLNVAVNYGGRWDLVQAAQACARAVRRGDYRPEDIDEARFGAALCLADLPEPELFIRTSGETRISNFLLWQMAYTELYFTETLWPDFDEADFDAALAAYAGRERRFGGLAPALERAGGA